jgi:hypothetical protein
MAEDGQRNPDIFMKALTLRPCGAIFAVQVLS